MTILIFPKKCIACGLCQTYSDQFDYHDNGIVKLTNTSQDHIDLPEEFTNEAIIQAAKECPTQAIKVIL